MPRRPLVLAGGLAVVLLATCATLLVAVALKSYCLTSWAPGHQPVSCYNDIQNLWYERDMVQHVLPYQGAVGTVIPRGQDVPQLGAGEIEYPVLTGVFAWLTALPVNGPDGFLIVSALALSPFALFSAGALYRLAGRRALIFALSPQLAIYAFLNWDLLPVAATVGALWAWRRERYGWTGVLLAVGACAKIWPGFVVVPLLVQLALSRRGREAGRLVAGAVLTALAVNLPFLLLDARGWAGPFIAQSARLNDGSTNSPWYVLFPGERPATVNAMSAALVAVAWAGLLAAGHLLRRRAGGYPAVQVAAAMVSAYVVLGRVDSPQYGLWLLPFLVVLAVPPLWQALFAVTNVFLWLEWSWLWQSPHWSLDAALGLDWLVLLGLTLVFLGSPLADAGTEAGTAPVTRLWAEPGYSAPRSIVSAN